jgi:hypothetical protein
VQASWLLVVWCCVMGGGCWFAGLEESRRDVSVCAGVAARHVSHDETVSVYTLF